MAHRWIDSYHLVDFVNQALKGELQTPTCTNFGDALNLTRAWQEVSGADEASKSEAVDLSLTRGLVFL